MGCGMCSYHLTLSTHMCGSGQCAPCRTHSLAWELGGGSPQQPPRSSLPALCGVWQSAGGNNASGTELESRAGE